MEHAEEANPVGDESAYVGVWPKPTPPHMPFSFLPVAFFSSLQEGFEPSRRQRSPRREWPAQTAGPHENLIRLAHVEPGLVLGVKLPRSG
jgi:hypothetical protein